MTSLPSLASDNEFAVVRRGYDRAQVDEHLERVASQLRTAGAARDTALAELEVVARRLDSRQSELQAARSETAQRRADADALRAQVAELSTIPHTVDGMSERLQQMVRIAQDEVNDMRQRATTSASHVLALAQAEADELRERSEKERKEFESERRTAQEALRSQLEESRTRLDQLRNESDGQRAKLDAELAERRGAAEQELTAEMEERRSAMLAELATQESRRRDEAGRIVDSAQQQAKAQLADAETESHRIRAEARSDVTAAQRELQGLRALQHQVSEQLTSVRALLDWTLPQMPGTDNGRPAGAPPAHAAREDNGSSAPDAEPATEAVPAARPDAVPDQQGGRPIAARPARVVTADGRR